MPETEWLNAKEGQATAKMSPGSFYRAVRDGLITQLPADQGYLYGRKYSAADCRKLGGFSQPQTPTRDPQCPDSQP